MKRVHADLIELYAAATSVAVAAASSATMRDSGRSDTIFTLSRLIVIKVSLPVDAATKTGPRSHGHQAIRGVFVRVFFGLLRLYVPERQRAGGRRQYSALWLMCRRCLGQPRRQFLRQAWRK